MLFAFLFLLLLIFYLSLLVFVSLITMCLSVFLPGFILHGTPALLADYFLSYVQKFSGITYSNVLSGPFSLFLLGPL